MLYPSLRASLLPLAMAGLLHAGLPIQAQDSSEIGREVSVPVHLQDDQEFVVPLKQLLAHGQLLFTANWTHDEGGGRPLTKGTGNPLSDPSDPLVFPRNFNRISAPDANSCAGCHNSPIAGGNGDIVANVFVLGQRFDFATFDGSSTIPTKNSVDEQGRAVALQTIANSRATPGMFGAGYIEMLSRQMTADLQVQRNSLEPGHSIDLITKGIPFGRLTRRKDGTWDVSKVEGLAAPSLATAKTNPPSLIVRPFHQAGNVVSIRQFSNNAFNHHHGIQTTERFGVGTDPDGDGVANEMTRADVTAVSMFQASMPVPGRVIPNRPEIEQAILVGETRFKSIGCAECHLPSLPLGSDGWIYSEPNPYNPSGNLQEGQIHTILQLNLTSEELPLPRLPAKHNEIQFVPAFTDFKLHDITTGPTDFNMEALDMNQPAGSDPFFEGNRLLLTRKLWGVGSKPNFFHHGQYTTLRDSILAHSGEAIESRLAYQALSDYERRCVVEFLKSLRNLPAGTQSLVIDEMGHPKTWPPLPRLSIEQQGDQVIFSWAGNTGLEDEPRLFQVQSCSDLATADWTNLGVPTQASTMSHTVDATAAFYRVLRFGD